MQAEKLKQYKEQLLATRKTLLQGVDKTLNEISDSGNVPDPNDRATLESGRNFELRIRGREHRLVKKIDEALARIEDGSFGICEDCGEEIGEKRLEARPVTTCCINCKTLRETIENSTAG